MIDDILKEVENIIEYKFNDKELLKKALDHYSDNTIKVSKDAFLEFLGDNFVNNYISKLLFNYRIYDKKDVDKYNEYLKNLKNCTFYDKKINENNTMYSKLSIKQIGSYYNYFRSNEFLGNIGINIKIDRYISYNNKYSINKIKIAANAIETITSAILLDSSNESMHSFLNNILFDSIIEYIENNYNRLDIKKDYKTILQEIISKKVKKYPIYKTIQDENIWKTEIYLGDKLLWSYTDLTKKSCEQNCSKFLIVEINNNNISIEN